MKIFLKSIIPSLFFAFMACLSQAQVEIVIQKLPANTPKNATIYLAGNMNAWNPKDESHAFTLKNGQYTLSLHPPKAGMLEFKCTRGDWGKVEGSKDGQNIQNRIIDYDGTATRVELEIATWVDQEGRLPQPRHTASRNVRILSDTFHIPQLGRQRRVWIYLPNGYDDNPQQRYPVLYMHDGQNLFDEQTSYVGEWGVDETLDSIHPLGGTGGCIVVAADHGGDSRRDEYSPWKNAQYGGGEGADYVQFIVQTLKPHIDQHYRTLPGREDTGIMGSSMGGLISLYAGLEYPEVFSKLGLFSPAFWFSHQCYAHASSKGKRQDTQIYLLIGRMEGERYVKGLASMYHTLRQAGFQDSDIVYKVVEDGRHQEAFWRAEFPLAYQWLFGLPPKEGIPSSPLPLIQTQHTVMSNALEITLTQDLPALEIRLLDTRGETLMHLPEYDGQPIPLDGLPQGYYLLQSGYSSIPTLYERWIFKL